ncbi:MAG: hypothetical protein J6C11_03085 [Spirochaetaceae bacterium]|nr:hypothetical protein [Spirochaetaceae bacterium]
MRMIYSMKRKVALVVSLLGLFSLTAYAATSGTCGDGVNYTLKNGTLTITGSGAVESKAASKYWVSDYENITKVVIDNGVILSNSYSLQSLRYITAVEYGDTVTTIKGISVFDGDSDLSSFTLREGVGISASAFGSCRNLNGAGVKLVDANGNDKTSFYNVDVEWNTSSKNYMTVKGNLEKGSVVSIPDQQYTGEEIKPAVTVTWNGQTVSSDNYDVTYSNNTELGTATVTIKGKDANYYTGTLTQTFTIKCDHSFGQPTNNGDYHSRTCTVCGTVETEDHTLTDGASDNVITESCSKCKVSLGTATITATNATYDGTAQETATVAYGTGWTGDRNLTVTYANNVDAGTATASITIGGVTARTTFTIQPKEITGAAVAIEQGASFVYSGEPFTPAVSVTLDGKPLAASDYQVSYAGNVNAGQAMVTVTGRGNYSGSATATFTIAKAPAPTLPAATVSRNYAVAKVSVPTGIVAGEGSSVSVGTASGSGSDKVAAVALDAKGNLTFTLSGGADGDEIVLPVHLHSPNYEGPITATVTVTLTDKLDQRPLTVKATSTTVLSGGSLELSIDGGSGKGAVTYEVINGTGSASLSGSTLTGGAPGTVTVIATKAGTSQYNPARSQPLVITIE